MKTLLKIIGIGVGIIALVIVSTIWLFDANRFKEDIEEAVFVTTGYELNIAGEVSIDFFPSFALVLNDVRFKNPAYPQELASTSAIVLNVDSRRLMVGELLVKELSADDFHINYFTGADGNSIWDVETPSARRRDSFGSSTADAIRDATVDDDDDVIADSVAASSGNNPFNVSVELIRVANASIDVQDLSTGTNLRITNLDFESIDSNINGRPFALDMSLQFINGSMSEAMPVSFTSNVTADFDAGNITIDELNFTLTPLLLQGQVAVTNFDEAPQFQGSLQSTDFDVFNLLQTLGLNQVSEDDSAPSIGDTAQQIRIGFSFEGDASQISLPEFTATMGDSQLQMDAELRYATDFVPMSVSYNIISSGIDLSAFASSDNEEPLEPAADPIASDPASANGPAPDTPLPLELLNSMNMRGSVSITSLVSDGIEFRDINIFTNLEDGQLDIETQPIAVFGGTLQGNMRLNASGTEAQLSTQLAVSRFNLAELVPYVSQLDAITGNLNLESDYSANGTTVNELRDSLTGSTAFAVADNSVDIGLVKQIFTAIAALSPNGESIEQWPDVIRFSELAGFLVFENGIEQDQSLNIRMDNFDITGSGGLDLDARNFDYKLAFTVMGPPELQTIPIGELYHDVQWPVDCVAATEDPVSQYCGPDFTRVRDIFTQMAANQLQQSGENAIIDAIPEELQDTARSLLRGLLD